MLVDIARNNFSSPALWNLRRRWAQNCVYQSDSNATIPVSLEDLNQIDRECALGRSTVFHGTPFTDLPLGMTFETPEVKEIVDHLKKIQEN